MLPELCVTIEGRASRLRTHVTAIPDESQGGTKKGKKNRPKNTKRNGGKKGGEGGR